jgi:hypothetical protein
MCDIWSAGKENNSACASGLSVVEYEVSWPTFSLPHPAIPHAKASATAKNPARACRRITGWRSCRPPKLAEEFGEK